MGTVQHLPRHIGIELVRGFTSSGRVCTESVDVPGQIKRYQFIELPLLERVIEEIDRWPSIEVIRFFHFGEAMAHPKYRTCLEILSRSQVASRAMVIQHTNGLLLKGEQAEAILETGIVKKLAFSLDGLGDQADDDVARGPHLDRALENIREFKAAVLNRRPGLLLSAGTILPRPRALSMAETTPREEALRQLHDLFDPLGVAVEEREMHNFSRISLQSIGGKRSKRVYGGCPFVETDSLYLTVNGWAQPCCAVHDEGFHVGNAADTSLGDLLNNEPMTRIRHTLRLDGRAELPHCKHCELSLGESFTPQELQDFWKARDDRGMVGDLEERTYLFGHVTPTPHRPVRVDLGCGRTKLPGFIGVDRFPLQGVDVVADIERTLPFASDSVDLVYACHSLEHIDDLSAVIREIYRICKHGAQICIIAPYYQQGLNLANPYHKQVFNEHTPRFWTANPASPIDPAEYFHPHAATWGLIKSDNSPEDIDIRCVRMEFFYFPGYRDLTPDLQRFHRQHGQDICDQIIYHLIVHKTNYLNNESTLVGQGMELFESPYVEIRRLQERYERLEASHREALERSQSWEASHREAVEQNQRWETRHAEALRSYEQLDCDLREATGRNEELVRVLSLSTERREQLENNLESKERENSLLHARVRQLEGSHAELESARAELERLMTTITSSTAWQVLQSLRDTCDILAPRNTLRRQLLKAPLSLIRTIVRLRRTVPERTVAPRMEEPRQAPQPLFAGRRQTHLTPTEASTLPPQR